MSSEPASRYEVIHQRDGIGVENLRIHRHREDGRVGVCSIFETYIAGQDELPMSFQTAMTNYPGDERDINALLQAFLDCAWRAGLRPTEQEPCNGGNHAD